MKELSSSSLSRRDFLKIAGAFGVSLLAGCMKMKVGEPTPTVTPENLPLPDSKYNELGPILYSYRDGSLLLTRQRNAEPIVVTKKLIGNPIWSPNKESFLFRQNSQNGAEFITFRSDGTLLTQTPDRIPYDFLYEDYEGQGKSFYWSGRDSIFWANQYNKNGGIYMFDLTKGGIYQLIKSEPDTLDRSPSLSPDGSLLSFIHYESLSHLWIYTTDVNKLKQEPNNNLTDLGGSVFGGTLGGNSLDYCSDGAPGGNQNLKTFWLPDSSGFWVATEGLAQPALDENGNTQWDSETRGLKMQCMGHKAVLVSCQEASKGSKINEIAFSEGDNVSTGGFGVYFSPDRRTALVEHKSYSGPDIQKKLVFINTETYERNEVVLLTQTKPYQLQWINNNIVKVSDFQIFDLRDRNFYSLQFTPPDPNKTNPQLFW